MAGPREVAQEPIVGTLPTPAAWLLGYVRTDVPGYREIQDGASLLVVPDSSETGYRFDDYVDAITALVSGITWTSTATLGVEGIGDAGESYPDRLGWIIGANTEAGSSTTTAASARVVPPAGIPLMGATWTRVESEADRRQVFDRSRRNQGYFWGDALVWSCKLTMHRWAFQALLTGWCLRGKVTLGGVTKLDTPISTSDPAGAITGYALGLGGVRWVDSVQSIAEVEFFIGGE